MTGPAGYPDLDYPMHRGECYRACGCPDPADVLRSELADLQARFEASQLLANQTLKELARVSEERDRYDRERTALQGQKRYLDDALSDARFEIERLHVDLADARSPELHRGTVLKAVPLTHDGIRLDKAIRPRGVTG